jgi:hypothetical protein
MTGFGRWAFAKAFSAGFRAETRVVEKPRVAKRLDENSIVKTQATG